MKITCWGARGSIPVSGEKYLKYGGNTPCLDIRTRDGEILVIDAGTGIRELGRKLLAEKAFTFSMLFTHAHWDHVLGFPFFMPIYRKETRIHMYGCPFAQNSVKNIISKVMEPPNFPIKLSDIKVKIEYHTDCLKGFSVKSMNVTPILLSHPNQGLGYKMEEDGITFVFLTDNELTYKHEGGLDFDDYLAFCQGADLLIHDSEFTEEEYKHTRTWGHSTYNEALRLAMEAGVKRFGLYHHNQDRSDKDLEKMLVDCRKIVKKNGSDLDCFITAQGMEIDL